MSNRSRVVVLSVTDVSMIVFAWAKVVAILNLVLLDDTYICVYLTYMERYGGLMWS